MVIAHELYETDTRIESFIPSRCSIISIRELFPENYNNVHLSGSRCYVFRSNEPRYVAAHRSELDEPDTTIDKWSIDVCYSPCCPRLSQTADQRFGNIWSDNILSSFTAQTGHWPLRDFPRTTMHNDWFDKHCAHTMVNTTGRVAVLVVGRYARKAGMLNLSVSLIIFDFMQNEFLFSL